MADTEPQDTPDVAAIARLAKDNNRRLQELASQGLGLAGMAEIRIEALLELLGDEARTAFEMIFHTKLSGVLDEMESQLSRSKLLQGVPGQQPPVVKLTIPGTH